MCKIVLRRSVIFVGLYSIVQQNMAIIVGMPKVAAYIDVPLLLNNKISVMAREYGRANNVPVIGARSVKPEKITVWVPNVKRSVA